jgi:hypothetical protein
MMMTLLQIMTMFGLAESSTKALGPCRTNFQPLSGNDVVRQFGPFQIA